MHKFLMLKIVMAFVLVTQVSAKLWVVFVSKSAVLADWFWNIF